MFYLGNMVPYPWGIRNKTRFALLGNHEKNPNVIILSLNHFDMTLCLPFPKCSLPLFLQGYWRVKFADDMEILTTFYLELSRDTLIFWLNVESTCVLVFQALFIVQDRKGKGCSALLKWTANFGNPSISYNSFKKNEDTHSFLKGFFQK